MERANQPPTRSSTRRTSCPNEISNVLAGRIAYDRRGTPRLVDRTVVVDRNQVACPFALLEGQDLRTLPGRPGVDHEVLFTAYGYQGFEVMGVDRGSRRITNYSRSPERDASGQGEQVVEPDRVPSFSPPDC
jgi:hypothetical protein